MESTYIPDIQNSINVYQLETKRERKNLIQNRRPNRRQNRRPNDTIMQLYFITTQSQ